ncbi:MAG TPA: hypothetical protein VIX18_00460 [Nitrospirota bacterium]
MMTDSNLRIWDAVSKTDPAHTKKVTFGRTFTSIDAHWQVMQATKQFGPVGEGWRYEVEHSTITLSPEMVLAVADVKISWRSNDDVPRFYGPIRATCEMWSPDKSGKMRVDEDAPKKAMTDALTKGLSHLGFSADVFLGLFDDNRYVQKLAKEFADKPVDMAQEQDVADAAKRWVADQKGILSGPMTKGDIGQWEQKNSAALKKLQKNFPALWDGLMIAVDDKKQAVEAL